MNFLLFHLKRLLMFPIRLVTSPGEVFGNVWSESGRNKSLLLGLPALVVAFVAVTAIGSVQLLNKSSLESKYDFLYQKTTAELTQLTKEIARDQKVQSIDSGSGQATLSEEHRVKLLDMRKTQKIYLDKLISLDPKNDDYRYELAKLASSQGKRAHAFSILNELAPEDVPGYPKAHFVLAQHFFDKQAQTAMDMTGNLNVALKHVNHVLTRDEKDDPAKLLKARILTRTQSYQKAYELYEDLFEKNPNYYRELEALNERMGRTEKDRQLFEKALGKFEQLAAQQANQSDDKRWIVIEAGIAKTLQKLERYSESEARLLSLIQKYAADPKGGPRRVFLQRLIADTYIIWANTIADTRYSYESLPPNDLKLLLDLYTKAYRNQPENVLVLQSLARLSLSENVEIADQARAVYDPITDAKAPSSVLNQLGNFALLNKRFSEAIRYYERAREKSPRDPAVLNNLSFSYLVAGDDDRNPERALQLIDEAIRNLPKGIDPAEASKFLHTKATALKQQDRLQEALAVYERALKSRPNHADTLRSLIECYRGLAKLPPEQYISRLDSIEQQLRQRRFSKPVIFRHPDDTLPGNPGLDSRCAFRRQSLP